MEERPIDRGYAWVICLGVGISHIFLSGPIRSLGVLLVEVNKRFSSSGSMSSAILSTMSVGMALTSPVAATLADRYGQRKVIAVGGLLCFSAAFLTVFAPNALYICIVFGTLTGMGLGCMMAPSMVIIGYYFKKRLSLANGLSMTGGSVGTMTLPVLFTYVMETYSFQGGMLIYSALLLHIIVAAMLLRPISAYKPVGDIKGVTIKLEVDDAPEATDSANSNKNEENGNGYLSHKKDHIDGDVHCDYRRSKGDIENVKEKDLFEEPETIGQLHDAISRTGSVHSVYQQPPNNQEKLEQSSNELTESNPQECTCKSCLTFVYNLYDWTLFRDPVWILYALSTCTGHTGYASMCVFLPPFAAEKGISPYWVSFLISLSGAVTVIGRIGGGAFADLGFFKRTTLTAICFLIIAMAGFLQPPIPTFPNMVVFSCILGVIGGVCLAQMVSVVIELMGIQKLSASFGLSTMVAAIVQIPIPMLIGFLKDYTGTYDWAIYTCSLNLLLGAVSTIAAARLATRRKAT